MEKKTAIFQGMMSWLQIRNPVCLHVEWGRIQIPKICILNYECWHCGFDQWLEEMGIIQNKEENSKVASTFLAEAARGVNGLGVSICIT